MPISTEDKKNSIRQNIKQIEINIYDLETRAEVLTRIGDKENLTKISDALVKYEKMLKEFRHILAELSPESEKK
jgi:hypothetical protein